MPIFTVAGRAIPTAHLQKKEPSDPEVKEIQEKLITAMQALFDRYKHLYSWQEKRLVIKQRDLRPLSARSESYIINSHGTIAKYTNSKE
jgi:hypothetical protein